MGEKRKIVEKEEEKKREEKKKTEKEEESKAQIANWVAKRKRSTAIVEQQLKEGEHLAKKNKKEEEQRRKERAAQRSLKKKRPDVDMPALGTLSVDEVKMLLNLTEPNKDNREVIWRGDMCSLKRSDLKELITPRMDISDETIDAMLSVLEERRHPEKVICISTFESGRILGGQGREVDDFILPKIEGASPTQTVIAQPCWSSGHWTLVVVYGPSKEILAFNSISRELGEGDDPEQTVGLHECAAADAAVYWRDLLKVDWPLRILRKESQRQPPGSNDCGAFVLYWIRCLMFNLDPTKEKDTNIIHSMRGELAVMLLRDRRSCVQV